MTKGGKRRREGDS